MILALPYHPSIPVNFDKVARDILKVSGNEDHHVLVVSREKDRDAAFEFSMGFESSFKSVSRVVTLRDGTSAAHTANLMLQAVLRFLHDFKPERSEPKEIPLVYLNPRFMPNRARWLHTIQASWFESGTPATLVGLTQKDPPQFVGITVFSAAYVRNSTLLDFLPESIHWREFLAWEIFNNAVVSDSLQGLIKPQKLETPA